MMPLPTFPLPGQLINADLAYFGRGYSSSLFNGEPPSNANAHLWLLSFFAWTGSSDVHRGNGTSMARNTEPRSISHCEK